MKFIIALLLMVGFEISCKELTYEKLVIERVEIVFQTGHDTKTLSQEQIKGRINTNSGNLFSQTTFDNDLKTLAKEFDEVVASFLVEDDKLIITLKVTPRPTIRHIEWVGVNKLSIRSLQDELGVETNTFFSRQSFNQGFRKVKALYTKRGYFEAELDYHITRVEGSNEVDILICISEGKSGKIGEIVFRNFSKQERLEILEMMCTKRYFPLVAWLSDEGKFNEDRVQQDQFMILNYLQNKGYADAHVTIDVVEASFDRINLVISADRGRIYRFGRVFFEGNTLYSNEKIEQQITTIPGCPYSPEMMRQTIQNIISLYGRCGYIDAYVDYEVKLREDEDVYDITLNIEEGEQYRVGLIKILGNFATQNRVILHETLLIPGELFNLDCLKMTELRLRNIGYFCAVNVYAVPSEAFDDCEENYRDVVIEVEETGTGNFGAFLGFSTTEDIFGGLNITERNFNLSGLPYIFNYGLGVLRGNGEFANATVTIGQKARSATISWTKPYVNDTRWSVGFDINRAYNNYINTKYQITTTGLTVHGIYNLNAFMKYGVHYRIKNADVDADDLLNQKEKPGDPGYVKITYQLIKAINSDGITSAAGASFIYDSTNRPVEPSRGYKSKIEVELAGLGGQYFFASCAYLNSYYYPLWKNGVLKYRADLRFLFPYGSTNYDNLNLDERLFLGGENTVRGFREYALGPVFGDNDFLPSGGLSMQIYSIEYNHTINSVVTAFLFSDVGSLSEQVFHFGSYYQSVGFGARLKVIAGGPPLVVGYGFPINPKSDTDVKRFFLTIGGRF